MYDAKESFLNSIFDVDEQERKTASLGRKFVQNKRIRQQAQDIKGFPRGKQIRPSEGKDKDFENYGETGKKKLVKKAQDEDVDLSAVEKMTDEEIEDFLNLRENTVLNSAGYITSEDWAKKVEKKRLLTSSLGEAISDLYSIDDIRKTLDTVSTQISSASFLEKPELQEIRLTLQGLLEGLDNSQEAKTASLKAAVSLEGSDVVVLPREYRVINYSETGIAEYLGELVTLYTETAGVIVDIRGKIILVAIETNDIDLIIEVTERDIQQERKQAKGSAYNDFVSKYLKTNPDISIGDKELSDAWKKEKGE